MPFGFSFGKKKTVIEETYSFRSEINTGLCEKCMGFKELQESGEPIVYGKNCKREYLMARGKPDCIAFDPIEASENTT